MSESAEIAFRSSHSRFIFKRPVSPAELGRSPLDLLFALSRKMAANLKFKSKCYRKGLKKGHEAVERVAIMRKRLSSLFGLLVKERAKENGRLIISPSRLFFSSSSCSALVGKYAKDLFRCVMEDPRAHSLVRVRLLCVPLAGSFRKASQAGRKKGMLS